MQLSELKERVAAAGIIGAGGAGFPTAVKIAEGADTLLINASECEPLLFTDYHLVRRHMNEILAGAEAVMAAAGIPNGYIAIKKHNVERLGLQPGQEVVPHIRVAMLPNAYPIGDEVILTYQVLRRVVRPGALPLSAGVLIFNAETMYNVHRAIDENAPVTEKWLTVAGKVQNHVTLRVPVGMNVAELLRATGNTVPDGCVVIDGGPAMGSIIDPEHSFVKKTTKGILVLPEDIPAVASKLTPNRAVNVHASSNCCQCTMCTDLCPRALIGYPLHPHKIVRTSMEMVEEMPELFTEAQLCSGCGVCEMTSCCQGISPARVYAQVKGILAKNKLRYQAVSDPEPDPERDYRILPSGRFKSRIGVAEFDQMTELNEGREPEPGTLTLLLKQHAGAPAAPLVRAGGEVSAGQLIAQASGAISANIHAPRSGVVQSVAPDRIVLSVR